MLWDVLCHLDHRRAHGIFWSLKLHPQTNASLRQPSLLHPSADSAGNERVQTPTHTFTHMTVNTEQKKLGCCIYIPLILYFYLSPPSFFSLFIWWNHSIAMYYKPVVYFPSLLTDKGSHFTVADLRFCLSSTVTVFISGCFDFSTSADFYSSIAPSQFSRLKKPLSPVLHGWTKSTIHRTMRGGRQGWWSSKPVETPAIEHGW